MRLVQANRRGRECLHEERETAKGACVHEFMQTHTYACVHETEQDGEAQMKEDTRM